MEWYSKYMERIIEILIVFIRFCIMKFLKKHRIFLILYIFLFLVGLGIIIFTFNNYSFYDEVIGKIISVDDTYIDTEVSTYGFKEEIYKQRLEVEIKNGEDKGEIVFIDNLYHKGEAYDQRYNTNDELFLSLNKSGDTIKKAHIEGYKRDKYVVLLIVSFILVLILVGKVKGFLSIISVILNIIIFNVLVFFNTKGISLPLLSFIGAIIFSVICLSLVSGVGKKTLAAIISSILGVSLTFLISIIVIKITNYGGVRFEQMELLTRPYEGIFLAEIILGGLGAIMDISISLSSSLNELIEKDHKITIKTLKTSGFAIGKDIMSTMINVLFFTYICSVIPNLTIYFRNGVNINHLFSEFISLEMTRALTGAIGITLTIPIAIYVSLLIYKKGVR